MTKMREIKMPSGATLKVAPAPFSEAKALYQAILREGQHIPFAANTQMAQVLKDILCVGFASPAIEAALYKCFERCIYNGGIGDLKIDADTFEPVSARQDYFSVCMEVALENVLPFTKNLYAEFSSLIARLKKSPA